MVDRPQVHRTSPAPPRHSNLDVQLYLPLPLPPRPALQALRTTQHSSQLRPTIRPFSRTRHRPARMTHVFPTLHARRGLDEPQRSAARRSAPRTAIMGTRVIVPARQVLRTDRPGARCSGTMATNGGHPSVDEGSPGLPHSNAGARARRCIRTMRSGELVGGQDRDVECGVCGCQVRGNVATHRLVSFVLSSSS